MAKLKGILLTEGMHGMISQVEGLAKALDIDFTHHKVELNHFWKLIPPNLSPVSQSVFKKINHDDFDVIISCGRKSVIPSIHLKKTANKKVFNIHIQDPKVNLNHFDFIVAPEHDSIDGNNVISTKGAIHYLTESEINEFASYYQKLVNKLEPNSLSFRFFRSGKNKVTLIERYRNEAALFNHAKNISPGGEIEKDFAQFMNNFTIEAMTIYGESSSELKKLIKSFGLPADYVPYIDGFSR